MNRVTFPISDSWVVSDFNREFNYVAYEMIEQINEQVFTNN